MRRKICCKNYRGVYVFSIKLIHAAQRVFFSSQIIQTVHEHFNEVLCSDDLMIARIKKTLNVIMDGETGFDHVDCS